jgi:hypothetical protein
MTLDEGYLNNPPALLLQKEVWDLLEKTEFGLNFVLKTEVKREILNLCRGPSTQLVFENK